MRLALTFAWNTQSGSLDETIGKDHDLLADKSAADIRIFKIIFATVGPSLPNDLATQAGINTHTVSQSWCCVRKLASFIVVRKLSELDRQLQKME